MPIQFELVTPERLLVSTQVDMVVVPGSEGNFGVLPGHAPLISTIRPGTVDLYEGREITERIFVVAGEGELFRRDEIEVEGGHGLSAFPIVTRRLEPRVHQTKFSLRDGLPGLSAKTRFAP